MRDAHAKRIKGGAEPEATFPDDVGQPPRVMSVAANAHKGPIGGGSMPSAELINTIAIASRTPAINSKTFRPATE